MLSWSEHVSSGHFVTVDGVKTFVVQRGEGNPLLLVHGWASSSFSWRMNIPFLSKFFKVVAVDLPGFGMSQPLPDGLHLDMLNKHFIKLLETLGIERANIAGHSMGGVVSSYLAAKNPGRFEKVVIINPSFSVTWRGRQMSVQLLKKWPLRNILSFFFVRKSFIRRVFRDVYVRREFADEEVIEGYYQSIKNAGANLFDALYITREFELEFLSEIKSPVLFILGDRDNLVPSDGNVKIAERFGFKIFLVSDAGHNVHEESSETVNNVILDFLRT